mmetsp:Transcript_66982/g.148423  ORF Transcript_66982/g.148423 Transcript_66982/m.148423 type:complete len:80 (-) Transcript_66982:138-377(-)
MARALCLRSASAASAFVAVTRFVLALRGLNVAGSPLAQSTALRMPVAPERKKGEAKHRMARTPPIAGPTTKASVPAASL